MRRSHAHEQRIRIAQAVREQLRRLRMDRLGNVGRQSELLFDRLERIRAGQRRLGLCLSRGWMFAAKRIVQEMESALPEVPHYVTQTQQAIDACGMSVPALRDVAEELAQLEDEFDRVTYDPKAGMVSVETEPIELEDIPLGPFQVRLNLQEIPNGRPQAAFSVIALEPNPAASNPSVEHPHVSDRQLCCGDGAMPIRAALESGRLSDFFSIVRSIVQTYNADSAYVTLENWSGVACHDCGYVVAGDDTFYCPGCDREFCSDCYSHCRRCDEYICLGCLSECPVCQDQVCESCLTTCPDCDRPICRTCVDEEQCPCVEEREEQENEDNEGDRPAIIGQEGQDLPARTEEAGSTAA